MIRKYKASTFGVSYTYNRLGMDLDVYYNFLRRKERPIGCSLCEIKVLPKEYEKHCAKHHSINPRTTCVWCRQITWPGGKKKNFADHLTRCAKSTYADSNPSNPRLLKLNHAFQQKHVYDFASLPTADEHERLWPLDVDPPRVEFRDANLNYGASCLEAFVRLKETHEWYHVLVKLVVFQSFTDALDGDRGTTRTLLFSCWCDGGRYEKVEHRQHRHMIVMCPKGHFKSNFWPKVKISCITDAPHRNFISKNATQIQTPMHFVNAMGYLSHRKSSCNFSAIDEQTAQSMLHFYLYRTLPVDFRLPLVAFWEKGVEQLLRQEKFKNVSLSHVVENDMVFENGRYKQKIKYSDKHERGLVLPVSKNYMPTTDPATPHYLYLMNGKKLNFEICTESTDDETWLQKQAEGGNCFYDNVEDELWTPRPRDQEFLKIHMPVVDENKRLTAENKKLTAENKQLKKKY